MIIQSVCMVYNEEDFIEIYLKNIEHLVDSILIMDGGSKDKTVEIIKDFKDKSKTPVELIVNPQKGEDYNHPEFHHGARRNFLISKATGDYLFNMDVDESIIEKDPDILRKLIKTLHTVYIFKRYTFWVSPEVYRKDWSPDKSPWLYRNKIGIFYNHDDPHSCLELNGVNLLELGDRREVDIHIFHWHYCYGRKAVRDLSLKDKNELIQKRQEVIATDKRIEYYKGEYPKVTQMIT